MKDQVESLKEELDLLFNHPRYFDIQHILRESHQSSVLEALEEEEQCLSADIKRYSLAIVDLKGGNNFKRVKQILKEFSTPDIFDEIFRSLLLD